MSNEPKHTATPTEAYSVFDKCSLSDIELIKKVSEWNTKLCDSGGKKWALQVPPNVNEDPDLLIQELCLRFQSLKQDNEQLSAQIDHDFNELQYNRAENAELIEALRWNSVNDKLPEPLETVWISNGNGWTALGCLVVDNEGSHWAESNGIIYQEENRIVSECESDDLDVKFWIALPKPPQP